MNAVPPIRPGILRRGLSLVSALLILIVVVAALYYFRGHHIGRARHGGSAGSTEAAVDLKPIEGEWLRPDTGVVLEISGADKPGPISVWGSGAGNTTVSEASVRVVDGLIEVRVGFSDDWCSGCAYRLTYDDSSDRLIGSYQEGGGKRRDALFNRQK